MPYKWNAGEPITHTKLNQMAQRLSPQYVIWVDDTTYYAESNSAEGTDYSGTTASTVISSAINALTTGRTWKETIVLNGGMRFTSAVIIPNYTRIVVNGSVTVDDAANCTLFTTSSTTHDYDLIVNGSLTGNKSEQSSAAPLAKISGYDQIVDLAMVEQSYGRGIVFDEAYGFYAKRIICDENRLDGIQFDESYAGIVESLTVTESGYAGGSGVGNGVKFLGDDDGKDASYEIDIKQAYIAYNYGHGVVIDNAHDVQIGSGIIKNNSFSNVGTSDGVLMQDSAYNIYLKHLSIFDDQGTQTQNYAVRTLESCDKVFMRDCNVDDNIQDPSCSFVGSNNHIDNNEGYVTRNWISSTGTAGEQTIAHGLTGIDGTNIGVLFSNQEDGADPYQSSAPDATNIYVTATADKDYQIVVWNRDDTDPK